MARAMGVPPGARATREPAPDADEGEGEQREEQGFPGADDPIAFGSGHPPPKDRHADGNEEQRQEEQSAHGSG